MSSHQTPHFPLAWVKSLTSTRNGLYLQRTRALNFLVERTGSVTAAYCLAREIIAELAEESFSETVRLSVDIADVYGVYVHDEGWYLKLTIDEARPEVAVISFHPLLHPLKTKGGVVRPYEKNRHTPLR